MSREAFEKIKFQGKSLALIERANAIIAEYQALGFVLTLRQLFYQRVGERRSGDLHPIVLHLGDHDPNGLDMTRDNEDRLALFARQDIEVRRLALNMDQVERYSPPPNFAKETDTRYAAYARQFGPNCWELDALDPVVIADLIRAEIEGLIDPEAWKAAKAQEAANRALLKNASRN